MIVLVWKARAVRDLDGNERVGTVTVIAFEVVKPLPVDIGMDPTVAGSPGEVQRIRKG
jgi:hypothetical protein